MMFSARFAAGVMMMIVALFLGPAAAFSSPSFTAASTSALATAATTVSSTSTMSTPPPQPASESEKTPVLQSNNLVQNWWPVTLTSAVDPNQPNAIELLGKTLVLFHDGSGWKCLEDRCSHRFAPLSEGRVVEHKHGEKQESANRSLQCAYHGWEFAGNGALQAVPQQSPLETTRTSSSLTTMNTKCGVESYPVQEGGGMLWVWPDSTSTQIAESTLLPVSRLLTEHLQDYPGANGFMRDLPYGYEYLAENLLDVSHLPFSHHGTGGFDRDQARPLSLRILSKQERSDAATAEAKSSPLYRGDDDDDDEEEVLTPTFQAEVRNASQTDPTLVMLANARSRVVGTNVTSSSAFYAPSHIRYRRVFRPDMGANIEMFLCPTAPGKSRVFLFTAIERVLKRSLRATVDQQPTWLGRLKQRLINSRIRTVVSPSVEGHLVLNDIFDGDAIFLQKQGERMRRYNLTERDYYTPTTADALVLTFRRWLGAAAASTALADNVAAAQAVTGVGAYEDGANDVKRSDMLNRYETHTKHCKYCKAHVAKLERRRDLLGAARTMLLGSIGASLFVPAVVGGLTKRWIVTSLLAAGATILVDRLRQMIEQKIQKFYFVDYVHAER